jgi:hypothetical protein
VDAPSPLSGGPAFPHLDPATGRDTRPAKAVVEANLMERTDRVLAVLEAKLGGPGEVLDRGLDAAVTEVKSLYRAGQLSREETILCVKAVRGGKRKPTKIHDS